MRDEAIAKSPIERRGGRAERRPPMPPRPLGRGRRCRLDVLLVRELDLVLDVRDVDHAQTVLPHSDLPSGRSRAPGPRTRREGQARNASERSATPAGFSQFTMCPLPGSSTSVADGNAATACSAPSRVSSSLCSARMSSTGQSTRRAHRPLLLRGRLRVTDHREVGHVAEPELPIVALDELAGVELQGVRTRAREELRDLVDEALATGWVGRPDPRRGIPERRLVGRLVGRERRVDEHEAPHGSRVELQQSDRRGCRPWSAQRRRRTRARGHPKTLRGRRRTPATCSRRGERSDRDRAGRARAPGIRRH